MEKVIVHEVGLRDGLQNQSKHVHTDSKLEILSALIASGIKSIEVTSFVSPKAVPQMSDAKELYQSLPKKPGLHFEALVPNLKGYERATESGAKTIALVLASTDTMNRKNINMSLDEALKVNLDVIRRANNEGIRARCYISTALHCPFENYVNPIEVLKIADKLDTAGADELVIADTTGGGNPQQVDELFKALVISHEPKKLAGHFHDTRGMGLLLAWVALQHGVRKFDSSIGGLGGCPFAPGATGNLATEDLVFMLNQSGYETGIDIVKVRNAVKVAQGYVDQKLGGNIVGWLDTQKSL
tara:strand:+ start:6073 stop:6972 length:900 start_codon:yes stop_codon:yes gene_type:complete